MTILCLVSAVQKLHRQGGSCLNRLVFKQSLCLCQLRRFCHKGPSPLNLSSFVNDSNVQTFAFSDYLVWLSVSCEGCFAIAAETPSCLTVCFTIRILLVSDQMMDPSAGYLNFDLSRQIQILRVFFINISKYVSHLNRWLWFFFHLLNTHLNSTFVTGEFCIIVSDSQLKFWNVVYFPVQVCIFAWEGKFSCSDDGIAKFNL